MFLEGFEAAVEFLSLCVDQGHGLGFGSDAVPDIFARRIRSETLSLRMSSRDGVAIWRV